MKDWPGIKIWNCITVKDLCIRKKRMNDYKGIEEQRSGRMTILSSSSSSLLLSS
jgi:hypothetical protein